MLLIADSGSTKTDWILINNDGNATEVSTIGFNPFFHSSTTIETEILKNETLSNNALNVDNLVFFGAGISSNDRKQIINIGFKSVFKNCKKITIDHDMKGAAIAACGDNKGIVCILGTGSNSCFFDGSEVYENVPSLGYILGDEASGAYFGKILLTDFLYKKLPEHLHKDFINEFNADKDLILETIYKKPNANVYLASFMKFIVKHSNDQYVKETIKAGFSKFASIHICTFKNYNEYPVHFIGSVAHLFNDILSETAVKHNFKIGNIIQKPVISIAKYYCNKLDHKLNFI